MTCKLCGKPITEPRHAWRESVGWVSPVGAKGMTLATQTGQLAHSECVNLLRLKVPVAQESLL